MFPVGHYHSPDPSPADCDRALQWLNLDPKGVELDEGAQVELAQTLGRYWGDLRRDGRWSPSDVLGLADAAVYSSMLRHLRPRRVMEVGSGYTTAVALDTNEEHGLGIELVCIEPYADRLRSLLRPDDSVVIREQPVQDVDRRTFDDLGPGDILFIDSTHVAKHGSDVVWLFLHILPNLAPGVIVHVHDIFWPFEYPSEWLAQRRGWNEIYLLHAFLSGNSSWKVDFFNDYIWTQFPEVVEQWLPEAVGDRPGGIWLRKVA